MSEDINAQQSDEDLAQLYGPAAPYSDHKRGATIRFWDDESGQEQTGRIIWICAPGPSYQGGPDRPQTYVVDCGGLFPTMIYPADVIE
jgi:hypothetical protein